MTCRLKEKKAPSASYVPQIEIHDAYTFLRYGTPTDGFFHQFIGVQQSEPELSIKYESGRVSRPARVVWQRCYFAISR